jgi:hypothetical protein
VRVVEETGETRLHLLPVVGVGGELEVATEVDGGGGGAAEALVEEAARAELVRALRRQHEEQVDGQQRFGVGVALR